MSCSDPSFFFSCDDSYLAEDTTVQCRTPENVNNGHHCCKTTTRKGKARPQDFYCFLEKGSPEANYAYCLGLADTPPFIHGLNPASMKTLNNQNHHSSLRSQESQERQKNTESRESIFSRITVLLSVMFVSLLCLVLYKSNK